MRRFIRGVCLSAVLVANLTSSEARGQAPGQAQALKPLTWGEVKARFEANNPSLRAGEIGIDESKANEITAYLRPNPQFTILTDGTQIVRSNGIWQPFSGTLFTPSLSYLHERRHKRELRLESAKKATDIAISSQDDLDRTLLFTLRGAFVGALQAKAVLRVVLDNLNYWDQVLKISRDRFHAGDIAQIDLDRLELQRVQFESDVQTAEVNLRTAKIQLLMLLNDRTPVDQFDVVGLYEYNDQLAPLDDYRKCALDNRPD